MDRVRVTAGGAGITLSDGWVKQNRGPKGQRQGTQYAAMRCKHFRLQKSRTLANLAASRRLPPLLLPNSERRKISLQLGFPARSHAAMVRSRRGDGGGGSGKVTPNLSLDPEGTRVLNLSVLRRLDPAVTDILITAAHVVAYNFDADSGEWVRRRSFVARRNPSPPLPHPISWSEQPRFQLVVMNRLNTENLVEDLLTDFEYDMQVPYVMYRNAADEIIGIWFYNPQECHEVAHLFSRIQYAFSRASPKANRTSKSDFEELEVASAVPTAHDTLEQSTFPGMTSLVSYKYMNFFEQAAACVDDTIGGTEAAGLNQSLRSVPSPSLQPHSASASETSALPSLLPSRTSSVHMRPFDANISHNSATIQPSSLVKVNPTLLPPMTSTQTTMADAVSSPLSVLTPVRPPLVSHQLQSVPLHHHPFALPVASPSPPYGMPLLQPFPPPKPSPLLTPAESYVSVLTRDQVKSALLRLVQVFSFSLTASCQLE
ncbi:hypothetical protein PR202_ga12746 [Eleusine coracana subsp. coracana]|uniref:mRNA-decapping enzyme-like protein n=1 Tax=Eleusine coracana subsp. coracana TaxID=191504 RepID=A0AAV5CCX0_ELECO|nr:hypothetical protein PR202_ga12746 [Eleusine coracana subsp. coracana]